jgi:glutamate synthase (NADPH/NADH) large chain
MMYDFIQSVNTTEQGVTKMDLNALSTNIGREHDACGIFARIEKSGEANYRNIHYGIGALKSLRHRAGYVMGEGDGCGLLIDIPRALWGRRLKEAGLDMNLVHDSRFFVGHLFMDRHESQQILNNIHSLLEEKPDISLLLTREDDVHTHVLGPLASQENPLFVQVAGLCSSDVALYALSRELEERLGVHVASLSRHSVVYKVVGDDETLLQYYPDLQNPLCATRFVLAHTRFSTNTRTSFHRVQPFGFLGHNGEINTITRFYSEAGMMGAKLDPGFSDSQMVNGFLEHLTHHEGWSLFESMELVFPPIVHEIKQLAPDLRDMYMFLRALWGPFAQGPAGVMTRCGNEAVFSVDALGLRPMWLIETKDAFVFSSEQGIVPVDKWVRDPKPLAPGEKIGVVMNDLGTKLYSYPELQREVMRRLSDKYQFQGEGRSLRFSGSYHHMRDPLLMHRSHKPLPILLQAFGWREDDVRMLEHEVQTGAEPIRSLGYDGPLAALDPNLNLLPDFLQETVAVVTNPAIDREREIEHFSTRAVLGRRPSLAGLYQNSARVELASPLLFEALPPELGITRDEIEAMAHRHGTMMFEDALELLHDHVYGTVEILVHRNENEGIQEALKRFNQEALRAVQAGANVIVLDDRQQFVRGKHIDVYLVLASVHKALQRPASSQGGEHLRRRTSLVLRSGAIRNLHDVMVAIGLGADAVSPYLMWELAASKSSLQGIDNLYTALCKGIEKVLSTLGIHEIRGYERLFSAIGLDPEVAQILGVPNFCGSANSGFGFSAMEAQAVQRQALFDAQDEKRALRQKTFQLYPRIWKSAGAVAQGQLSYSEFYNKLAAFERDHPTSLRHLLGFKGIQSEQEGDVKDIDASVDIHSLPFVISSMSFGSQGETAYRAYAEAAARLNIVALNGEGGEIKELLNLYPRNRGRQVASGRFGINAEVLNGAYVLEIKIGQGAKPGEGGHLPGSKVTEKVANARNATPGVDLISPSNNHDIYSIEDLAQVIYELRMVNPFARIAVKVPVVPNIGTIAVGIVKAGADIVNLSGFDGGTGAARAHALRYVGLPVEIGIKLVHDALCEAGLRNVCEIWADGGIKSGADALKAILLGANRVGFGTMAMVALGCTSCRGCHKDTCHVGIATQMTDAEEALMKGVTTFVPREFDTAVEHLVRFFEEVGAHVKMLTAKLGVKRTQDLVGRRDLLCQLVADTHVDVNWLLEVERSHVGLGTNITVRSTQVMDAVESRQEDVQLKTGTGDLVSYPGHGHTHSTHPSTSAWSGEMDVVTPPRCLGTSVSGEIARNRHELSHKRVNEIIEHDGVAGNGFASYHMVGMTSIAHGGAQDGTGKAAYGGKVVVLKSKSESGVYVGGSVGKGLAYGAQRGLFIVQGNADARAGIRLSGADLIVGGEVTGQVDDELACIAARANLKGFAFEYMTAGRALVLGDPGPWICSGMTGGRVYLRHAPEVGLTEAALRRRIAKGAKVTLRVLDLQGISDVTTLLEMYRHELLKHGQKQAARRLTPLLKRPIDHFLMVVPGEGITDQTIATE